MLDPGQIPTIDVNFPPSHIGFFDFHDGFPARGIRETATDIRNSFVPEISCMDNTLPQPITRFELPPPFHKETDVPELPS